MKYTQDEIIRIAREAGFNGHSPNHVFVDPSCLERFAALVAAPLQYKIDELMLEYCPNEMTEEQLENYKKHQRPYLDEAIQGLGDI